MKINKIIKNEIVRKETFLAVYGVEDIGDIVELFRKDYNKIKNKTDKFDEATSLFQKYVLAVTFLYSPTSIKNNLGLFRKVINKEGGIWKENVKSTFYIFDIYKIVSDNTDKTLTEKEVKQKDIAFSVKGEIERIKNIVDKHLYNVANNQDREQVRSYYLAYLLGLSTGRRFTEILKTITIRKRGEKYTFRGILKKDKNQDSEIEANILYLSVSEVKKYLKELRAFINKKLKTTRKNILKDTSEADINRIFSKVYNNATKRISNDKIPNFHELRHYYTIEGTKVFKLNNESDKDTRYRILGHHVKSDSTRTYKTIK